MSPLSAVMLVLNLILVALGLGTAVQRDRLRGFLPLGVFLLYLGADSFARTSGGRYIVPVDWILITYFAVALAELVQAAAESLAPSVVANSAAARKRKGAANVDTVEKARGRRLSGATHLGSHPVVAFLFLLLLGGLIPLAGVIVPKRYTRSDTAPLLQAASRYAPEVGAERDMLLFLEQPDAILAEGRLLYPLYYRQGEGEPTSYAPYTSQEFPRTVFVHIGPRGLLHLVLPGARTPAVPNASDAIVLGCRVRGQTFNLVQAVAVILPDQGLAMVRSPTAPLRCPLPDPVCDNNGNCR